MFTSAINSGKTERKHMPRDLKTVLAYLGVSLFTLVFSIVYNYFGHGVTSPFMTYVSLIPMIGGLIPFFLICLIKPLPMPNRAGYNLINAGVGTAAVGCAMRGAFVIADKVMTAPLILAGLGVLLWLIGFVYGMLGAIKEK